MSTPGAYVLAITGASGAVYAVRLLDVLLASGNRVHLVISPAGAAVLRTELGLEADAAAAGVESLLPPPGEAAAERLARLIGPRASAGPVPPEQAVCHDYRDLLAPIASGSWPTAGMVVCPCSGGTLAAIASGMSDNLIHRAADVHLKERRRLVLVPRETPLSLIHLENMRRCVEAGAVVLPAAPGWYHGVQDVADLVNFVVARVCDQLGVPHALMRRWGEA
ncbi:MAG: UbiX family flavin prenyltransferase [Pirellulales bacterium]|nr:UbiX family flavin prenyltransferase [Pirellulales bacterium]